jgi:hypothetical protein
MIHMLLETLIREWQLIIRSYKYFSENHSWSSAVTNNSLRDTLINKLPEYSSESHSCSVAWNTFQSHRLLSAFQTFPKSNRSALNGNSRFHFAHQLFFKRFSASSSLFGRQNRIQDNHQLSQGYVADCNTADSSCRSAGIIDREVVHCMVRGQDSTWTLVESRQWRAETFGVYTFVPNNYSVGLFPNQVNVCIEIPWSRTCGCYLFWA